jgi:hypothetical protein
MSILSMVLIHNTKVQNWKNKYTLAYSAYNMHDFVRHQNEI